MRERVQAGHPHREAASVELRPSGRGAGSVQPPSGSGKNGDPLDTAFLLAFFKALSDPARLRVAAALAERTATAGEAAGAAGLPLPQVVKHLARLEEAAIVRRDGDRWTLDDAGLRARAKESLPTPRTDDLAGATDERSKVLAALIRHGRLQTWPAGDTRKRIVLDELVQRFAIDRVYSEREVNAILAEFYDDYATLRRALVDYRYMNRDHGAYWRGAGNPAG